MLSVIGSVRRCDERGMDGEFNVSVGEVGLNAFADSTCRPTHAPLHVRVVMETVTTTLL